MRRKEKERRNIQVFDDEDGFGLLNFLAGLALLRLSIHLIGWMAEMTCWFLRLIAAGVKAAVEWFMAKFFPEESEQRSQPRSVWPFWLACIAAGILAVPLADFIAAHTWIRWSEGSMAEEEELWLMLFSGILAGIVHALLLQKKYAVAIRPGRYCLSLLLIIPLASISLVVLLFAMTGLILYLISRGIGFLISRSEEF